MIYIGIDPRLDGALAALSREGTVVFVSPTPAMTLPAERRRRDYDIAGMRDLLRDLAQRGVRLAALEAVHTRPGDGATSAYRRGYGLALWEALLVSCQIPYTFVSPRRWRRSLGVVAKDRRPIAARRWPAVAAQLSRRDAHGIADALMLAAFAREVSEW